MVVVCLYSIDLNENSWSISYLKKVEGVKSVEIFFSIVNVTSAKLKKKCPYVHDFRSAVFTIKIRYPII